MVPAQTDLWSKHVIVNRRIPEAQARQPRRRAPRRVVWRIVERCHKESIAIEHPTHPHHQLPLVSKMIWRVAPSAADLDTVHAGHITCEHLIEERHERNHVSEICEPGESIRNAVAS